MILPATNRHGYEIEQEISQFASVQILCRPSTKMLNEGLW